MLVHKTSRTNSKIRSKKNEPYSTRAGKKISTHPQNTDPCTKNQNRNTHAHTKRNSKIRTKQNHIRTRQEKKSQHINTHTLRTKVQNSKLEPSKNTSYGVFDREPSEQELKFRHLTHTKQHTLGCHTAALQTSASGLILAALISAAKFLTLLSEARSRFMTVYVEGSIPRSFAPASAFAKERTAMITCQSPEAARNLAPSRPIPFSFFR